MATMRNAMVLDDRMTPVLRGMVESMNQVIAVMERMNNHLNRARPAMQGINASSLNNAKQSIQNAANQVNNLNNNLNRTRGAANQAGNALSPLQGFSINLTGLWAALNLLNMFFDKLNQIFDKNDQFISLNAKLNLINDGGRTYDQMQKDVLQMTDRTRSDYGGTAALISRIGVSGSPAFKKTDDIMNFSEQVNKLMVISGTNRAENQAVLLQLSQAMGSGRLQGDEFRSISEQAPMFRAALAQGMGVQPGALKKMSKDGQLTADKIYEAIMKMSTKTNKMFETMPWTFGQAMTVIQNNMMYLLKYAEPVFNRLTQAARGFGNWLQTDRAQRAMQLLAHWFDVLFVSAMTVFNMLKPFFNFVLNHGEIFTAVGNGVVTFIIALTSLVWITNTVKAAWLALNAVMDSNPIIFVIAIVAAVVSAMIYWWQTSLNFRIFWIKWCGDIQALFYNAVADVVRSMEWLLNKYIDVQKTLGNPIALMWGDQAKNKISEVSAGWQQDLSKKGMSALDWSNKWQNYEINTAAKSMLKPERPGMGMGFTPGKPVPVEVKGGKISLEKNDIKYLKDLAMKEYALNIRQVNPNITAKFGDIHQTADVDEILYKLEQTIVNTAQTHLAS